MNDSGANLVQISLGDLGHVSVPFLWSRDNSPNALDGSWGDIFTSLPWTGIELVMDPDKNNGQIL